MRAKHLVSADSLTVDGNVVTARTNHMVTAVYVLTPGESVELAQPVAEPERPFEVFTARMTKDAYEKYRRSQAN